MRFVHLGIHTEFSITESIVRVPDLIKAAVNEEMPALALTDLSNLHAAVKFYGKCLGQGIKPILGSVLRLNDADHRVTLLSMNNHGWRNLTELVSRGYIEGQQLNIPCVNKAWILEQADDLILLLGIQSDVGKMLITSNPQKAEPLLEEWIEKFGNRVYLALTRTDRPDEDAFIAEAVKLAKKYNIGVVAHNDVHFVRREDYEAHEARVCIADGYVLGDNRRPKTYSPEQYFKTTAEMTELFSDIPSAIENSYHIAKRCNVTLQLGKYFLPDYPIPDGHTIDTYFAHLSKQGLEERLNVLYPVTQRDEDWAEIRKPYDERIEYEINIINSMGFPGYFLIVMEFIQWSKDNGIPVGPGRGSGAGSLVAYALKITDLDPLEFDLLFERFLNPERVSMPDFDVDFCMDRRDEVIDHVSEMYGREAVSQIITFGSMAAKAVVRDVGRVLGHAYGFVDRISKLIPPDPGMTLAKAFEAEPKLPELYEQDEEVKDLIDMARRLEGVVRNAGKHAGGVVIAPTKITDFAPLYCDDEGHHPVTQFDKNDVEYAGLVKFDFLGLRTLTIIDWALGMINPRLAKEGKPPVDIAAIPIDDKKSFALLQRFETTAVFQLESRGMKDLIKRLQPDCFEDMIALVALFRPGPLQSGMVDNFIERKHGKEAISYPDEKWQHESLKPILEPTYGIILYQEQVMQIAQTLAGYTLGGADMLRRAMGKKKPEEMAKQRAGFEEGAVKNGVDGELAMKIFDLVEKFAGYGFNKSHSAAYALVSYQTLWLKTHFPAEFMAAVMTADMDNTDKIVTLVDECQRMGLTVIPPDVNTGRYRFSVNEDGHIVYGIGAVKGVGEGPIEAILDARDRDGPFRDLFDFCNRVDIKKLNKRVMEKLILSGAMDRLGPHRAALMATLEEAMRAAEQHAKAQAVGQVDMFGVLTEEIDDVKKAFANVPHWPDKVWLEGERETLGLYLTGHPINQYSSELRRYTSGRLCDLHPTSRDTVTTAAGLVIAARSMVTKRGNKMGIFTLDDRSGRLDVTLFSEALEKYEELMQKDRILVVSGQVSFDDFSGGLKMSARELLDINDARERFARAIRISLDEQRIDERFFPRLCEILEPARAGVCPVQVNYRRPGSRVRLTLGTEWRVTPTDQLIDDLRVLLGRERVELVFD